jgi:non-specific serine/threonine protein kinase
LLADQRQDEVRYRMLDTIREYAREELLASGELPALQRRHADYFARMTLDLGLVRRDQDARDQRLTREMANIRAALHWAIAAKELAVGQRLATPLGRYWYSHGALDEGGRWLRALLALDAQAGDRAIEPRAKVWTLYSLILITLDQHDFAQAEALAHEGLALARQVGDGAGVGNMLTELGHVAEARGDLDAALALFEEGLATFRASGQDGAMGRTLSSLGAVQRARGDYAQARSYLEEALAWTRERNFSWAVASGLVDLGHVACEQGDGARALALYHESLGYYQTTPNPASLAWCLEGVVVARALTDPTKSPPTIARFSGAIAGLRQRAGVAPALDWPPFTRTQAATRATLGANAFAAAEQAGAALSVERMIAEALAASG